VLVVLFAIADAEQGAGAQVGVDDAVDRALARVVQADEGILVLGVDDQAPAYRAGGVERRAQVDFRLAPVPCAQTGAGGAGKGPAVGVLAHQVDRSGRAAGAVQQAAGAANDFNVVVDRHVGLGLAGVAARHGRAVDLQLLDFKTARVEIAAHAVDFLGRDAGGVVGDVEHGLQRLVFDALAGDHADRLRRVAYRQRQAGGRAAGARGIGTVGAAGAGHGDGRQGLVVLVVRLGLGAQAQRRDGQKCAECISHGYLIAWLVA
jgi:hypothetical protein